YAHSRIRKYAASRLRLAQYSRQISSVVSITLHMTLDKAFYARRKNEVYWGTPGDDNAAEKDLDKSDVKIYSVSVL
ncbi:MAG: hypothetical protein K2O40_12975, partial [Lachnospiraceae bacterium]|nr:hypothetical protein [Lachnospiraceae bacterium]